MQGRRIGLASVAGVALGSLGNVLIASIGLAALFTISPFAFTVVKYMGAFYLVYLGIHALRGQQTELSSALTPISVAHVFRDGFVIALLNPKTTIFFAAFLPQFVSSESAQMLQSITLGSLFAAIAVVTDIIYALAAGAITPTFTNTSSARTHGRYLTAGASIGLGVFTAVTGSRNGK